MVKQVASVFLAILAATNAQLYCYYCNDCTTQQPIVAACQTTSVNNPILTPPPVVTSNPWNPINPWDPIITPPGSGGIIGGNPWDPIITPTPPGSGVIGGGGIGPTSPPFTTWYPWPLVRANLVEAEPSEDDHEPEAQASQLDVNEQERPSARNTFACLAVRSYATGREVVRRGCVQMLTSDTDLCYRAAGGVYASCSICTNYLCNAGIL
ncbi:uncharacterized protein LOC129743645 [Uranotaenia lowii]|uniref:uncharacterized protein LOC129743645 n=1 Tax=Uranotaenia lowii TaxID=190385 RepID=UPI00247A72DD|nr:uncharacterized protein LOC129743645 [Uranotaenia lowii]